MAISSAKKSLLQIMQSVCRELAIPVPNIVVGNVDEQIQQLLALAQLEGEEFANLAHRDEGWQQLRGNGNFSTVNGVEAYDLPNDFGYFIPSTNWDVNFRWQLMGPLTPQEWDVLQYGISPAGPRRRFRVFGDQIHLSPVPTTTGDVIAYEYYSLAFCQSALAAPQFTWLADTDYYRLDDRCLIHGTKWRFLRAKGLDYAEEMASYEMAKERAMARNGGNRALPLNARPLTPHLLGYDNIPDTGFGT